MGCDGARLSRNRSPPVALGVGFADPSPGAALLAQGFPGSTRTFEDGDLAGRTVEFDECAVRDPLGRIFDRNCAREA